MEFWNIDFVFHMTWMLFFGAVLLAWCVTGGGLITAIAGRFPAMVLATLGGLPLLAFFDVMFEKEYGWSVLDAKYHIVSVAEWKGEITKPFTIKLEVDRL